MNDWKKIKVLKSDSEKELFEDFCKKVLKVKDETKEDLSISIICDGQSEIPFKQAKELIKTICEKASLEFDKIHVPVLEVVRRNEKNSMAGVIWFTRYTSEDSKNAYLAYIEKTIM